VAWSVGPARSAEDLAAYAIPGRASGSNLLVSWQRQPGSRLGHSGRPGQGQGQGQGRTERAPRTWQRGLDWKLCLRRRPSYAQAHADSAAA